jgi:thermitase
LSILWRSSGAVVLALVVALLLLQAGVRAQEEGDGAPPLDSVGEATVVAGELIVTYEEGASEAAEDRALQAAPRAEVAEELEGANAEVVEFPRLKEDPPGEAREAALEEAKEELEDAPGVVAVDYNFVRELTFIPNDPRFKKQWGFRKTAFRYAWNKTRGGGVRVAVVDSGIAQKHPDLKRKIYLQRDFVDGDRQAEDNVPHGTHVSGTVAAVTDNRQGGAGGCPGCQLLVAKVGDRNSLTDRDIVKGIRWSADRGAKAINMSFSGPGYSDVLKRAVDYADAKGAVLVGAAGNEGDDTRMYPAAFENVIAVAATNRDDRRTGFSTYGDWVDVAAPGKGIISTVPGGYASYDGTSMAAPHVTALAGLLAAQGRDKAEIRDRILSTAVDLGREGRDPYYGEGRINANKAVSPE